MRDVLSAVLEHAGYAVAVTTNGAEALEYLHREASPSVIVMDLQMPVMDGWQFLAERNRDPALCSIPVIVLSGEGDVERRVVAAHASYLPKPIHADRLIAATEHLAH